jgi:hypothetical protein
MNLRFTALGAAALLLAPAAFAQKPMPRSPLEIGFDTPRETVMRTDLGMSVDARTQVPTGLFNLDFQATPGTPEAMARQFLNAYSEIARLPAQDDLQHDVTTSGHAGYAVHFQQTVGGVPVLNSDVVVNVTQDNRVPFALFSHEAGIDLPSTEATIEAAAARAAAMDHLGIQGTIHLDQTALVVVPTADGARLAWQVRLMADAPMGEWEALVDARTGELFRVADRMLYHRGGDDDDPPGPTIEAAARLTRVDATGIVFVPDPLTRTGSTYGQTGYVDGNDADTAQLTAARTPVTLRDIESSGGMFHLRGPWAAVLDWAAPFTGIASQATADWSFTRSPGEFEAANTYYHIDTMMRYINETLGIVCRPFQGGTSGIVPFDHHGFNGADNSSYSGGTARLQFGEGGVDDAEDADVVIHELGHGVHHWLVGTGGGPSNSEGLSEGHGDYLAVSYSRAMGLQTPASASYNWVFKWDGHNPFWPGRITNYAAVYPTGTAPHTRGQHWSTANMRIWDIIGGEDTDRVVHEGLRLTGVSTTQPQAAQAAMQAGRNMGYAQADLDAMLASYNTQGFNVTMPLPTANEGGPGVATALSISAPAPNPTTGGARFVLRSDRAQEIEVVMVDVLGRTVATVFDGALGAGESRDLEVGLGELPAGVYVVRASGDAATVTRSITIAR